MTGIFGLIALVVGLITSVIVIVDNNRVYAETDALVTRAQLSADAATMADRIDDVIANMERRGMTTGHSALIFKHPKNDVGLDYQALKELRDRARKIAELDKASTAYQTGLADMRGTLREMEIEGVKYALIHNPITWFTAVMLFIGVVLLWIYASFNN